MSRWNPRGEHRALFDLVWLTLGSAAAYRAATALAMGRVPAHAVRSVDEGTVQAAVLVLGILPVALAIFGWRRWKDADRLRDRVRDEQADRARHDPLTGLPNRAVLSERLGDALARCRARRATLAVLLVDLDRFKMVNDTHGYEVGDRLLVGVAERLRETVRSTDVLARLGGDEFVIVCEDIGSSRTAEGLAERITTALAPRFVLDGEEVRVTASIGIAVTNGQLETAKGVLRGADAAMYRAKAQGSSGFAVFDRSMREQMQSRAEVEERLRRALDNREFRLHYQPMISVRDGRLVGVEALLRWEDPEQGLVPPAEFVPLLEDSGLIVPVGAWVLEEACLQARQWRDAYPDRPPIEMAVNVSVRQLAQADFPEVVTHALHRSGIDRSQLTLEITEAALMDDVSSAWAGLRKVKSLGISLAIDDFGTGYSSLSYVRRFALDMLKIDQSFVRGLAENAEDHAIVTAVISMAHALGMLAVAEGVETPEQLAELRTLGCDLAQGYLITRPAPPELIDGLLARGSQWFHTRDGMVMPS